MNGKKSDDVDPRDALGYTVEGIIGVSLLIVLVWGLLAYFFGDTNKIRAPQDLPTYQAPAPK